MKNSIFKVLMLLLLIVALVCSFVACNNDAEDPTGDQAGDSGESDGNSVHTHSGGIPTCTDKPICIECGKSYGSSLGGEHNWNYECDVEGHKKVCTRCPKVIISEYAKTVCDVCKSLKTLVYELSEDKNSYVVVGAGTANRAELVIPSVYNRLPITAIGEGAFIKNRTIETVAFSENLTEIGAGAFRYCDALKSVDIPDSVKIIGDGAFAKCEALEEVSIGHGVIYVGGAAFAGTKIADIVFPDSLEALEMNALASCYELESVTARGVKRVGEKAFAGCSKLKTLILSDDIDSVYANAFEDATQDFITSYEGMKYFGPPSNPYAVLMGRDNQTIKSITMHPDTVAIAAQAFKQSNVESVTIGGSVINIGYEAFYSCKSLLSVHIGDSVENIWESAFNGCIKLGEIYWGKALKTINKEAFLGCLKISSIELGDGVKTIHETAFYDMPGLMSISVSPNNQHYYSASNCLIEKATKKLVRGCGGSVIPDNESISIIGYGAFSSSKLPDVVYIPDSVTIIEENAFINDDVSLCIVLGKGIEHIYSCAFGATLDKTVTVYYKGTRAGWGKVSRYIPFGSLQLAEIYFYSEQQPTGSGKFWHFVDGEVAKW